MKDLDNYYENLDKLSRTGEETCNLLGDIDNIYEEPEHPIYLCLMPHIIFYGWLKTAIPSLFTIDLKKLYFRDLKNKRSLFRMSIDELFFRMTCDRFKIAYTPNFKQQFNIGNGGLYSVTYKTPLIVLGRRGGFPRSDHTIFIFKLNLIECIGEKSYNTIVHRLRALALRIFGSDNLYYVGYNRDVPIDDLLVYSFVGMNKFRTRLVARYTNDDKYMPVFENTYLTSDFTDLTPYTPFR